MTSSRPAVLVSAALLAAAAGCASTARGPRRTRLSAKEMFEKAKPAIVRIEGEAGVGTGFIVSPEGRIATNLHVIAGSPRIWVVLADGQRIEADHVVAFDPKRDLAIISINPGKDIQLPTLPLGDSDQVATGDKVIAIGNPLGVLDFTISDGLISARRQFPGKEVLQISAPISVGSSGGPLFNSFGEVIGIATFIAQEGQNLNFGMPSNYLRPLMAKRGGVTIKEFHKDFHDVEIAFEKKQHETSGDPDLPQKPKRQIPNFDLSTLDGCSEQTLIEVFRSIGRAIEIGAPVYNRGEYKACYVIYSGTADKLRTTDGVCSGVRKALGEGLDRAAKLSDPSAKAWAMRDAFDGLLNVIVRKLRSTQGDDAPEGDES